jgi:hypothetical protein
MRWRSASGGTNESPRRGVHAVILLAPRHPPPPLSMAAASFVEGQMGRRPLSTPPSSQSAPHFSIPTEVEFINATMLATGMGHVAAGILQTVNSLGPPPSIFIIAEAVLHEEGASFGRQVDKQTSQRAEELTSQ